MAEGYYYYCQLDSSKSVSWATVGGVSQLSGKVGSVA